MQCPSGRRRPWGWASGAPGPPGRTRGGADPVLGERLPGALLAPACAAGGCTGGWGAPRRGRPLQLPTFFHSPSPPLPPLPSLSIAWDSRPLVPGLPPTCVRHGHIRVSSCSSWPGARCVSVSPAVPGPCLPAQAALDYGMGPRASALVCGYTEQHRLLEQDLARLKHTEVSRAQACPGLLRHSPRHSECRWCFVVLSAQVLAEGGPEKPQLSSIRLRRPGPFLCNAGLLAVPHGLRCKHGSAHCAAAPTNAQGPQPPGHQPEALAPKPWCWPHYQWACSGHS